MCLPISSSNSWKEPIAYSRIIFLWDVSWALVSYDLFWFTFQNRLEEQQLSLKQNLYFPATPIADPQCAIRTLVTVSFRKMRENEVAKWQCVRHCAVPPLCFVTVSIQYLYYYYILQVCTHKRHGLYSSTSNSVLHYTMFYFCVKNEARACQHWDARVFSLIYLSCFVTAKIKTFNTIQITKLIY